MSPLIISTFAIAYAYMHFFYITNRNKKKKKIFILFGLYKEYEEVQYIKFHTTHIYLFGDLDK